ncbi:transposase [Gillisia sp. Q332]|uniref:IS66 family transposase n=1 Tax=Gillisia xinjiangensis TaxID=3384765 RepID=UPI00391B93C5
MKRARCLLQKDASVRQYIFIYLLIENVPPDNNASESTIRNVEVKQKNIQTIQSRTSSTELYQNMFCNSRNN